VRSSASSCPAPTGVGLRRAERRAVGVPGAFPWPLPRAHRRAHALSCSRSSQKVIRTLSRIVLTRYAGIGAAELLLTALCFGVTQTCGPSYSGFSVTVALHEQQHAL